MNRQVFAFVGLLLLLTVVSAPGYAQDNQDNQTSNANEGQVIKIYTSWPLQGVQQVEGESMVDAARLALDHYLADHNDRGPAGFTIEIIPTDDVSPITGTWDSTIEAENAQRCIDDPDCMVYFATYNSGAARVSAPLINAAGITQISPANTYPGLTKVWVEGEPDIYRPSGQVTYFRTNASDDIQGYGGAAWAWCMGFERVYVLDDRDLYGQGVADAFAQQAERIGLEIVGRAGVESISDLTGLLAEAHNADADLIYGGFSTDTGGLELVEQMVTLNMFANGIAFMGPDGLFKADLLNRLENEPSVVGSVYLTFPGLTPQQLTSLSGQRFLEDFVERYGYNPSPWSTYAYQSMQVILDAINRAGEKDRAAILAAMRDLNNFEGLIGTFGFDENGDPTLTTLGGNVIGANLSYEFTGNISPDMHETCGE